MPSKASVVWMKRLLKVLLIGAIFLVMIRWFEHRQVYMPSKVLEGSAADLGRPFEDVFLKTQDGLRLNAWFFPAAETAPRKDLVLLLFHGNAGNISHRAVMHSTLLDLGLNVLALDYRGYGRSEGHPGESGTYLDGEAAYEWLTDRGFNGSQILVHGNSLGGGIASELALRKEVGGLILQNSFCSVPDIGKELFPFLPVRLLASIHYNTYAKLPKIKVPVMIMHSPNDEIIPFTHGQRNFEAANEPKLFWELKGGHNDTLRAGREQFEEGLNRFIDQHVEGR